MNPVADVSRRADTQARQRGTAAVAAWPAIRVMHASVLCLASVLCGTGEAAAAVKHAAATAVNAPPAMPADQKAEIVPVQHGIYMIYAGEGSNVTIQVGSQGVVVVDAAVAQVSDKVLAAIRSITDKPIRYLMDTSADADHVGGNENISKAGITYGGGYTQDAHYSFIYAHENVQNAMSAPTGQKAATPSAAWPTDTYFQDSMELYFNGEPIIMLYAPNAHTDGDSMVFFRSSDVIATGDVYITTGYPVIDVAHGGSINGIIAALNRIIDITIPKENQEDGTLVIPGHGRVSDEYDVVVYRDMVTIIRDRVDNMMKKGMTLAQIQAAKPSSDYDGRFGAVSGPWTTNQFIEAVYQTLKSPPQPPK